jgi:hypothetical protein
LSGSELVVDMMTHVKVLAWLHIVFGCLLALIGVSALLFFGGLAGIVGMSEPALDARIAVPILGGIGGLVFLVLMVLALPGIVAGAGLLKFAPWARILTIVLSALHLLSVPVGTALGIYGLWVLTRRETEALFTPQAYRTSAY